ncbi:FAD-dependent monooxygenase [Hydrogenophaga sp. 2FB]|uniref:FAD-dependent monooxygenase n=1 Tax=Hydrogenophaga sp. 2FB TaxID=2502187 RepID=UPI0010F54F90|nr:FAD-dependent monooxygenase [Hydrogenophaga sp. 2FB]
MTSPRIAIIGAGIGGLSAALALKRLHITPVVFEQATRFGRVGAGINLTPNAVRALDGLGVGQALRATAFRPTRRVSRTWDSGEVTSHLEMGDAGERRYGAPQLTVHRADLLSALEAAASDVEVHLGSRVQHISQTDEHAELVLDNGQTHRFDAIVGADGIHSAVRDNLFGADQPIFTGQVAFRSIVDTQRLGHLDLTPTTKWWGPNTASQIFTFLIHGGRELFVFATAREDSWRHESWSVKGTQEELLAAYAQFHPEVQDILRGCEVVLKTALYVREPMAQWTQGRVSLLGDACHPMLPFMAQGAAMGIEDAVVLARCLADGPDCASALQRYEALRKPRASQIQVASGKNDWLRNDNNADSVYGYDAWSTSLNPADQSCAV